MLKDDYEIISNLFFSKMFFDDVVGKMRVVGNFNLADFNKIMLYISNVKSILGDLRPHL